MKFLILSAKKLAVAALVLATLSCATAPRNEDGTLDREKVERAIATIQQLESAITWIAPIACVAVGIAAPEAIPACRMAVASANALKTVTDQAVAAYRQDPTAQNADAILSALHDLDAAWRVLDANYRGESVNR